MPDFGIWKLWAHIGCFTFWANNHILYLFINNNWSNKKNNLILQWNQLIPNRSAFPAKAVHMPDMKSKACYSFQINNDKIWPTTQLLLSRLLIFMHSPLNFALFADQIVCPCPRNQIPNLSRLYEKRKTKTTSNQRAIEQSNHLNQRPWAPGCQT